MEKPRPPAGAFLLAKGRHAQRMSALILDRLGRLQQTPDFLALVTDRGNFQKIRLKAG